MLTFVRRLESLGLLFAGYLKSTSTNMHCRSIRVIARELSVFWKFWQCVVCDVKVWQWWCLERVLEVYKVRLDVLWIASDSDYQNGIPV